MNSPNKTRFLNVYFQIHQPRRLGQFSFFDIGTDRDYFDDGLNQLIMQRVAKTCYLPTNLLLLRLIDKYPSIRFTFSISGTALRQMELYAPAVIESFRMLSATGVVEFLGETYYHSLSSLIGPEEFTAQVQMHSDKIHKLFGVYPKVFRNTELIYDNEMGAHVKNLGFKGIFVEGVDRVLDERSPNLLYHHPNQGINVFLRNYRLSDDVAFRFSQKNWAQWPLTPEKYLNWLEEGSHQALINVGMDYETFGEHQKSETGIFQFLEDFLIETNRSKQIRMVTPSEALDLVQPCDQISIPDTISWADNERDLSAWLGNDMQKDAFETLSRAKTDIQQINQPGLTHIWRNLQASDHFYYMSTKKGDDGNIHNYFSPYPSPYEAFMNYMNTLTDLELKIAVQKEIRESEQRLVSNWGPSN